MEARQAEQMQLLDTLQAYLGMCQAATGVPCGWVGGGHVCVRARARVRVLACLCVSLPQVVVSPGMECRLRVVPRCALAMLDPPASFLPLLACRCAG